MKKFLAGLFGLWLCIGICHAQLMETGFGGGGHGGGGGGGCTQATNFLARTTGLSGTETSAYTTMICGLVTDGIISGSMNGSGSGASACGSTLDFLYFFVTNTTTTANLNLCSTSYTLTSPNPPTFVADGGYTGDSTTSPWLDTNFNPITAASPNMVSNSVSVGVCVFNNRTTPDGGGSGGVEFGVNDGTNGFTYLQLNNGTSGAWGVQDLNFPTTGAISSTKGCFAISRTTSGVGSLYLNGSSTAIATDGSSSALSNANLYLLSLNNIGSATNGASDNITAAYGGAGITGAQTVLINNRINAGLALLGKQSY